MIHKLWNHDHIITHKDQAFFIFQNCSTYLYSSLIRHWQCLHILLLVAYLCTSTYSFCDSHIFVNFPSLHSLPFGEGKIPTAILSSKCVFSNLVPQKGCVLCSLANRKVKGKVLSSCNHHSFIKSDFLVQQVTFFTAFILVQFLNSVTMIWFRRYSSHEHLFKMSQVSSCILVNKVPFQSLHLQ